MPRLGDVMTPDPVTITAEKTLEDAQNIMTEKGIRHLPVVEDGKPVGVISDRDLHLAASVLKQPLQAILVRDAATDFPFRGNKKDDLASAVQGMAELAIGSVLVVDDSEQLVGIYTMQDVCTGYLSLMDEKGI